MEITILYSLALLIMLINMICRKKNIVGIILYALYFGSSIFSVIGIIEGIIRSDNLSIFPYIILVVTYGLFFSPFISSRMPSSEEISKEIPRIYILFSYFYIICSLLSIFTYLPSIRSLIASGQWANNYRALLSGELIFPDSAPILHFATLVSGYCKVLAMLLAFAMMRNEKKNALSILLLVGVTGRVVCSAIFTSSRGALVSYALLFFTIYFFFFPNIEKNKKFFTTFLLLSGAFLVVPFFIQVTADRFRTGNALSSIIDYLGKAPVVFNYGVYTSRGVALGKFGWGSLFGLPFSPSEIGGNWGTSFYTFVGYIYIDWGLIGLLFISIIVYMFWNNYLRRDNWEISDLFLLFMHFSFLLDGVFVIGRDYCYIVLITFAIYFIIKVFFEKYHYRIGSYHL